MLDTLAPQELRRSTAARRVGELAERAGLFLAHFEQRFRLPTPEAWIPAGRPDLVELDDGIPSWQAGVLQEAKYQGFRHDLQIASFHPGHRAKWTAHELCHALVGFAWRPDGSLLFHALAARLAEALPVALWYFFDEADLRRCHQHAGGGALFGLFCAECEAAAAAGPLESAPERERWVGEGRAFLDRELAAVRRSVREGRPIPSRYATLDLASDGLAYAAAHGLRLRSPEMEELIARFFPPGTGHHATLEGLEARIEEVLAHLLGEAEAAPLAAGAGLWMTQDVAWRLLVVRSETEGEAHAELSRLLDVLAAAPGEAAVAEVAQAYVDLADGWVLPEPDDLFAVGYPLPAGFGRSVAQIRAGLETACPTALLHLGEAADDAVAAFVGADGLVREPLGRRFAAFLARVAPDTQAAAVAALEAAVAHAAPVDPVEATLGWDGAPTDRLRLGRGVELVRAPAGSLDDDQDDQLVAILREADGGVGVHGLRPEVGQVLLALGTGAAAPEELGLPADDVEALAEAGLLVPVRWGLQA